MPKLYSPQDQRRLLALARDAMEAAVQGKKPTTPALDSLPAYFLEPAACFVTLTRGGRLRGCVGSLSPERSLLEEVQLRAVHAALEDHRFRPVSADEARDLDVEISVLTIPRPLAYSGPSDLLSKLRPGVDGVVLKHGHRRATFLPQVWESLPDPEDFLDHLCQKMGSPPDTWRDVPLSVEIYEVVKFKEQDFQ